MAGLGLMIFFLVINRMRVDDLLKLAVSIH